MRIARMTAGLLALALCLGAAAGESGPAAPGVKKVPIAKILTASRTVDQLVEEDLANRGLKPNPAADDATFVRRVYLHIAGRIPTADETSAFLASRDRSKRTKLIDAILDSPGYASHLFTWYADLLRIKTRLTNNVSGEPYIHFVKEAIAKDKPYNQFVRELLAADGPVHERGEGATGYMMRDRGMPEDNMSNTVRIFLGTRLECAQCHDHPFDKWTQLQYFQMVAFTGGVQYRDTELYRSKEGQRLRAMEQDMRSKSKKKKLSEEARQFRKVIQPLSYGIRGSGTGLARLPNDYQYDNAKPKQYVKADSMFGKEAKLNFAAPPKPAASKSRKSRRPAPIRPKQLGSRSAYAKWMTSAENPRFTTVIANRMWKRAMGLGLIEPVDDMSDKTKPSNPKLMTFLDRTMKDLKYDLRQFLRVLYNSKTWQREASRTEPVAGKPFPFTGPLLRRVSAEQLWDSMLALVVQDLDKTLVKPGDKAERIYENYENLLSMPKSEIDEQVRLRVLRYKDPKKYKEERAAMQRKDREKRSKEMAAVKEKMRPLYKKLSVAKRAGDAKEISKITDQIREMGMRNRKGYRGRGGLVMARASDLVQPERPGHFLRQFGQSDRDQIEVSHTDPSVPQVLSLLNGFVERYVLTNKDAYLMRSLAATSSPQDKVRKAYLSILNRPPSTKERVLWSKDVQRDPEAIKDLVWTLVNTHEFLFVQ